MLEEFFQFMQIYAIFTRLGHRASGFWHRLAGKTQYTYNVCNYKNIFAFAAKQARKSFQGSFFPISKACTNDFYICKQCIHIIYIFCNKNLSNLQEVK
jgi:hypothetical protein